MLLILMRVMVTQFSLRSRRDEDLWDDVRVQSMGHYCAHDETLECHSGALHLVSLLLCVGVREGEERRSDGG